MGLYLGSGEKLKFIFNNVRHKMNVFSIMELPAGYTRLSYIESDGNQYIDTRFIPDTNSKMWLDFYPTVQQSTCFAGCRKGTSKAGFTINSGSDSTKQYAAFGNSGNTNLGAHTVGHHVVSIENGLFIYNGVETTVAATTLSTEYSVYLFACNNNGVTLPSTCRIYGCKLWYNGMLKRNFIPCINANGEAGFYDGITRKFYGNDGTGEFTKGPAFIPYIETTGEQFIDTGFVPNQDTRIVCEFMLAKIVNLGVVYGARESVAKNDFSFRTSYVTGPGHRWQPIYGNSFGTFTDFQADTTQWHLVDHNKNTFYFDGVLRSTCAYADFTAPYSMTIGAVNNNNSIANYSKIRIRSFKIYDNGILVRDMRPCVNANGEIGMYDVLNDQFYGNAGTGTFIGA